MSHPCDLTIAEAGAALRDGTLSSLDLTRAHLERIAERDGRIGAFVHLAEEEALAAAQQADRRFAEGEDLGPLHGTPFAVKDLIDVAGWPVRWGSRAQESRIAERTAPAVQRLLDGGAIPLGLVATYEMATVGPDEGSLYPQPRNPWNPAHVTGGSSSGSAAAVAAGMVRLTLGTDTGGSVRSPAAYCGVTGLKPSAGVVSREGVMELSGSMDTVGLLARSAGDAVAGWAVLSGEAPDARDPKGLRLAFGRDWAVDDAAHPALLPLLDAACSDLSLLGAAVEIVTLPDYGPIEQAGSDLLLSEAFALHAETARSQPLGPMARASILSGGDVTEAARTAARQGIGPLIEAIDRALEGRDALVLPTTLTPAPAFSDFTPGKPVWTPMRTIPFNLTGHPAISVPMGFAGNLPLGMQLVGRHGGEAALLSLAAAYEAATDHTALQPPLA